MHTYTTSTTAASSAIVGATPAGIIQATKRDAATLFFDTPLATYGTINDVYGYSTATPTVALSG